MSQQSVVPKRKAFEATRDAESPRFCAILDFLEAHFARTDIEDKTPNAAAKLDAAVDVEEGALDKLVAAHIAYRQALGITDKQPRRSKPRKKDK